MENQESTVPDTPNLLRRRSRSIAWSTVSKAALRSNNTSNVTYSLRYNFSPLTMPSPCCDVVSKLNEVPGSAGL